MSDVFVDDISQYPTGGSPSFSTENNNKIGNIYVNSDIFVIDQNRSGSKECPSLKRLEKLSKYHKTLSIKLYNNFLDSIS